MDPELLDQHEQLPAADRIASNVCADYNSTDDAADSGVKPPVVYFDGVCGLCNRSVNFILWHDRVGQFQFAPLQGITAAAQLDDDDTQSLSSIILQDESGIHRRSTAIVRILCRLGGGWRILGSLLWLVPYPIRNLGYRLIARYRYVFFGKSEACRLPTADERDRFLS